MLLFLGKKVTKKTRSISDTLACEDVSLHRILLCADCISSARIFVSFDHTQSPPICVQYYFSFILFYFTVFFIILPLLFRHMLLVPYIFLFFSFQTQGVFLSPAAKSTKAQYFCGSRRDMFHCYHNIGKIGRAHV